MGTASQSFKDGDPNEARLLEELKSLLETSAFDSDKQAGLEQALRDSVNDAIFGDAADAITKQRVSEAVQGKVMDDVLRKYKSWKDSGQDMSRWPFPKKPKLNP